MGCCRAGKRDWDRWVVWDLWDSSLGRCLASEIGGGEGGALGGVETFGQPAGHDAADAEVFADS